MRHAVHFGPQSYTGYFWNIWYNGWLGVDLFFALSGFLITYHLIQNWPQKNTKYYIYNYLGKRALRILPLYIAVLLIASFGLMPFFKPDYAISYLSVFIHAIFMQDYAYFASILVPLWSLGVEEKFYLLAPILVYIVAKFKPASTVCAGIILVVLITAIRSWYINETSIQNYAEFFWQYRAPFHFSFAGILVGAVVAVAYSGFKEKLLNNKRLWALGYFVTGLLLVILFSDRWLETSRWQMTSLIILSSSTCFAVLILCSLVAKPQADNTFRKMFRFIAKLAFPLYLFHLMVLPLVKVISSNLSLENSSYEFGVYLAVYLGFSILGALILHLAIEKPFLQIKERI